MTDYRSLYDKDFIGAWDLKDDKDVTVRITKVVGGNLVGQGGRKAKKPVIYMHGTTKGFAVNSTNGKTIAAMYGKHIEDWVGKRITLYKSTTRDPSGGDAEVECIRVRPRVPAGGQTQAPAEEAPISGDPAESDLSGVGAQP